MAHPGGFDVVYDTVGTGHTAEVWGLAYRDDGGVLASSSDDRMKRL